MSRIEGPVAWGRNIRGEYRRWEKIFVGTARHSGVGGMVKGRMMVWCEGRAEGKDGGVKGIVGSFDRFYVGLRQFIPLGLICLGRSGRNEWRDGVPTPI